MTNDELDQKWREAQARMKAMKDEEKKRRHKAIPKAVRQKVYQKYGGHCAYCGRPIDYKDYAGRPHPSPLLRRRR